MLGKSTSHRTAWEERNRGEDRVEKHHVTCANPAGETHSETCNDESLLKACVLRQEKLSLWNKNNAACNMHISHLQQIAFCAEKQVACAADLHTLPHQYASI